MERIGSYIPNASPSVTHPSTSNPNRPSTPEPIEKYDDSGVASKRKLRRNNKSGAEIMHANRTPGSVDSSSRVNRSLSNVASTPNTSNTPSDTDFGTSDSKTTTQQRAWKVMFSNIHRCLEAMYGHCEDEGSEPKCQGTSTAR